MKKRKLFVSLLSAMAIASTTVLGAAAAHYKGDINRDDSVSVSDIVYIQKHLTGKSKIAADKLIYADLNDDGKVNIFDFVNAVRVVLGEAPLEEVPSLTTPAVTTTITTTTSTTVSTTSTTPVTTTTTPKATTTTTTATSTTTTPETTTTTTTTVSETETSVTSATEAVISTEETTTVTETTVTSSEISTSATEAVVSTEETTSVTESETTASETTTTEAETTTTAPTSTTAGTTLIVNAETDIELDSTKELESMKLTVDTSTDYKLVFLFGDNWNTYIDLYCTKGVLTANYGSLIEAVEIEDDVVTITFKSGLKVDTLTLYNNNSTITIYDYTVKYVGDETTDPVETTATTSATATNTTTTVATTTVTESETTKAPESSVTAETTTTAGEITSVTSSEAETTASETVATTTETSVTSAETTTTVTTTDETVKTTLILDENKTVELDATKTLDTLTISLDTSATYYNLNLQFGNWTAWIDITCNNGTLTTNFVSSSNNAIEDVTIEGDTVVITFKEGTSVDALTFHNNGTTLTITDYDITYVGDTE